MDKRNIDLADTVSLVKKRDKSKEGYNFVGSSHNWTTTDEQRYKVKEIERITKQD